LKRPDSTTQLLAAIEGGDSQALAELLERQASWLRRAVHGRLPTAARDRCDSADVVQKTLFSFMGCVRRFTSRRPGALRSYLWTALLNHVRDEARRLKLSPATEQPDLDTLPSPMPSPLDRMIADESGVRVRRALATLSERDRVAVITRQVMRYSYTQVAEVIGVRSAEAARKIVTRALARLAEQMVRGEALPTR
jgi:RNA polymerase sigma-70 factor, ECF subfamily